MSKLLKKFGADDMFFMALFGFFIMTILSDHEVIDVIFFLCTAVLYVKYKILD